MARRETSTGGRDATKGIIPGKFGLSVGKPNTVAPPDFSWTKLTDVARLESGHTPSRSNSTYWNGAIPWVSIRDATGNHGKTIYRTAQYITEKGLENSSARLLPPSTVCLSRTASVGYVITMGVPMATSQDFVNWVCGPQLAPYYLHYLLMAEQDSIRRFAHGTTHQTMYYPEAKALHVCIPDRSEQDGIVEVVGALDDKIAANAKLASTAVELAEMKFAAAVRDVDFSEKTFADLTCVRGGGTPRTGVDDYWGGDVDWATPTDVTALPGPYLESTARRITYSGLDACASALYPAGSILMTSRATIGAFAVAQRSTAVNQGFIVVNPHDPGLKWWIYHEMHSRVDEFVSLANGATFLELSRGNFKKFRVRLAEDIVMKGFGTQAAALHARARAAFLENSALASIRDALLPQLMSGKIRVKDAEKMVEGVV